MATTTTTRVDLLELAAAALSSAVVASDQITALAHRHKDKNVRLKVDGSFVTDADLCAQSIIVQSLQNVSTDVRIVGEESEQEMAEHASHLTGHEERAGQILTLARNEIQQRYHHPLSAGDDDPAETSNGGTLPLAQSNNTPTPPTSHPHPTTSTCVQIRETIVDSNRVTILIDPLDGTKVYARGDYQIVSILIAIILDEVPCFGVICKPFGYPGFTTILDTGCFAIYGGTLLGGAFVAGGPACFWRSNPHLDVTMSSTEQTLEQEESSSSSSLLPKAVIFSSRSGGIVQEFVSQFAAVGKIHPEPMMIGGAGEKSLRIILGRQWEGLWFFPKPGTSLWDVAASDALLRATGGKLTDKFGKDMDYSKSRQEAENEDGVVACYDAKLHEECLHHFQAGTWTES